MIAIELLQLLPKNSTSTPVNLESFAIVPCSNSSLVKSELSRVKSKKVVVDGLDSTRYNLLLPQSNKLLDFEFCYKNSLIQLEHSHLRNLNNQILSSDLSANAWKIQNFDLEATLGRVEKEGEELRSSVDELNGNRKLSQDKAGVILNRMGIKWTESISNNLQIPIACLCLLNEIIMLLNEKVIANLIKIVNGANCSKQYYKNIM